VLFHDTPTLVTTPQNDFGSFNGCAGVRNRICIRFFATSCNTGTVNPEKFSKCPIKILNGVAILRLRTLGFPFRSSLLLRTWDVHRLSKATVKRLDLTVLTTLLATADELIE
jgi:hypothetical protein